MVQIVLADRRLARRVTQQPPKSPALSSAPPPASPALSSAPPPASPSLSSAPPAKSPARDGKQPPKAPAAQPPRGQSGPEEEKKLGDVEVVSRVKHPIFNGFRFVLLGIRDTPELCEDITSRGGQIIPASEFELSTHLCINGHPNGMKFAGSKIISKAWILKCCKANSLDVAIQDCLSELCKLHHQLFLCPLDQSSGLVNISNAIDKCESLTHFLITPGGYGHETLVTDEWLKLIIRKCYVLLRRLHLAGFTLNGHFSANNFIVDEALGEMCVKFGFLSEEAVTKATPEGKRLDLEQFIQMVRYTLFEECVPGHEINLWLTMLPDTEVEEILLESVLVMDLQTYSEKFTTLYESVMNSASLIQDSVVAHLIQYNGWQKVVESEDGNSYLQITYERVEKGKSGSERYGDTVLELLRLLRNCRQHKALAYSAKFALVVGQNFPNLISDLQRALFLARKEHQ